MTGKEHAERHEELHKMLDELVADFISHTENSLSGTSVYSLMQWSWEQTKAPSKPQEGHKP